MSLKNKHDKRIIEILENQIKFIVHKSIERSELFKIFGRYVDKRQIFDILNDPEFLKNPKLVDSVVLFADISGFTKFTNKSNTQFIFKFLSKTLNKCSEIINVNNGIVDKFVGDQIIGIFGIVDKGNQSYNALKSAIQIRDFFQNFSKQNVNVKISIVKGDMIYGNLGGKYKTDLTVVGKNVNFASRLCDYTKPGEILVGDKVYEKLKEDFNFRIKGFKKFKGFSEWSKVYRFVS
ncbi:MAG: adenylate/guanylate cyclase domain-containing protein [Nanoarchaeota archaeon]|nr:adenylate/guanylate cyclase domain-containing protein [Nanoarchaeota archaeon]